MTEKTFLIVKRIILILVIPGLLFSFLPELLHAKPKKASHRKYIKKRTREEAIEIIRTTSEEISALAGIEPNVTSPSGNLLEQSELLSDAEIEEVGDEGIEDDIEGENIEELEIEDDVAVDMETFKMLWLSYVEDGEEDQFTEAGISKEEMMNSIMEWLGTPYRFGGTTTNAIDCSAFTQRIYQQTANISIPRTARHQYASLGNNISRNKLEFGDLVYFHTRSYARASHTGIYLGDNLFAHASSRYGVTVSSLNSTYYSKRFIGGRRITVQDLVRYGNGKENFSINQ